MRELQWDAIDYAAYERATEAKSKVRRASDFADEVDALFEPPPGIAPTPTMLSTKLRGLLRFNPGEVTMWGGYSASKKSMFTGQTALDLCEQGQRVLMASFEMQPKRTIHRLMRQASARELPAKPLRDQFNRWTDDRLWILAHLGRMTSDKLFAVCHYFAEELGGQHVFIDSLMMVVQSEEHLDEQKQFMTDAVRVAQETGMHLHIVCHARKPANGSEDKPPTKYDLRGSAAVSDQAANVVTVWANKAKKEALEQNPHDVVRLAEPDAVVSVVKQRNDGWEGKVALWFHDPSLRFCDDRTSPVYPYAFMEAGDQTR